MADSPETTAANQAATAAAQRYNTVKSQTNDKPTVDKAFQDFTAANNKVISARQKDQAAQAPAPVPKGYGR
jgi:hypothetical protein